jgi:hypothetical protein
MAITIRDGDRYFFIELPELLSFTGIVYHRYGQLVEQNVWVDAIDVLDGYFVCISAISDLAFAQLP